MDVTVGISFKNSEKTLGAAIKSVFAQNLQDWRLILIDDGSTDRSLEIARSVNDPRVSVISDGRNMGLSFRLNQLSHMTNTEFYARMDADDIMHPDRLLAQVGKLRAEPALELLFSGAYSIDGDNRIVGIRNVDASILKPQKILATCKLIHPSLCGRTRWFKENPYCGTFNRSEDHELWLRTCEYTNIIIMSEHYMYYREPTSLSIQNYVTTCRTDRVLYLIYGPRYAGYLATIWLLAKSLVKPLAARFLSGLVLRRYESLTGLRYETGNSILQHVLGTKVPGMCE